MQYLLHTDFAVLPAPFAVALATGYLVGREKATVAYYPAPSFEPRRVAP